MIINCLKTERNIIILLIILLVISCNRVNNIKFEKSNWLKKDETGLYIYRNSMLSDLVVNHKLKGLTYKQLINLIGKPENIYSIQNIYYEIQTKYSGIDINYKKTLEFSLNNDSIIVDFKVVQKQY
jgi:hypothetical protein